MAWYNGTFSCGHEGRVNIIGPTKDREWKRKRLFDNLCPECEKKWREEEIERKNAEAIAESAEMELPLLNGSEKQVAWANTLRLEQIQYVQKRLAQVQDFKSKVVFHDNGITVRTSKEEILLALDYGLSFYKDAKYWIDSRFSKEDTMLAFLKEYRLSKEFVIPESVEEDIKQEEARLTVKPENASKDGIVDIKKLSDGRLAVKYVKDDLFRTIIKKNDAFSWDWNVSCWCRKINEFSGAFDDRAADIGNQLLAEGFTVKFMNIHQIELSVSDQFEPECKRWIKFSNEKKSFFIVWEGKNDTLYNAAKKLSGSKWNGAMYVPVAYYKQIEDFAETMEFNISKTAQEAILKQRSEEESFLIKSIHKAEQLVATDEDRLRKKLEAGGTIIGDLIDET